MILAIDPGNEQSAYVVMQGQQLVHFGKHPNDELLRSLRSRRGTSSEVLAIEMVASYGMPVGADIFETCVWIGRFIEAFPGPHEFVYRKDVKMHICGSMKAKDGNIRQAIIDRYPATGGGSCPQIGTKKQPGPLYGVTKDVWQAIGVAITYQEAVRQKAC